MNDFNVQFGNDAKINGDFILANKINDSFNKIKTSNHPNEIKDLINELVNEVNHIVKALSKNKADQIVNDLQMLTNEVTNPSPRKKWWELSVEGIKEAAASVGEIGNNTISILNKLLPFLNSISS
jgi:signal peptidase I